MAGQNVRMHGPALLGTAVATKYTVPNGAVATLQHIHVSNPSAASVAFSMSIGVDTGNNRIYNGHLLGPGQVLDVFCQYTLNANESIQAFAGANNVLQITLDGKVQSALAVGSAVSFNPIYEVDFTTLPTQPMVAAGSYTIDGKTWWAKGGLGSKGVTGIVNGSGFRINWPAPLLTGDFSYWRAGAPPTYKRAFCMPLAQLPSFNPLAPLAFMARIVSPIATIAADSEDRIYTGVIDVAANALDITGPEHDTHMGISRYSDTVTWQTSNNNYDSNNVGPAAATGLTEYAQNVQGLYRFMGGSGRWAPLIGPWTGALTVPDDHVAQVNPAGRQAMLNRSSASPSFYYTLNLIDTNLPALDYYLTHLRIVQPRAVI
jgi:hypothetical protein